MSAIDERPPVTQALADLLDMSNQARQHRAYALWNAAKLERRQGNRELADRLKAAGNRLVAQNFQVNNPPERKIAALKARAHSAGEFLARAPFRDRGLFDRTISALLAGGIDAPERLLFTPEAELKRIGAASLAEIRRYRARFLAAPSARCRAGSAGKEEAPAKQAEHPRHAAIFITTPKRRKQEN